MSLEVQALGPAGLELTIDGVVGEDDYSQFVAEAERRVRDHGHVDLLVHLSELSGASLEAVWEDLKLDVRDLSAVERLALVGRDRASKQHWMTALAEPFTAAEVRFYTEQELGTAKQWIRKR